MYYVVLLQCPRLLCDVCQCTFTVVICVRRLVVYCVCILVVCCVWLLSSVPLACCMLFDHCVIAVIWQCIRVV